MKFAIDTNVMICFLALGSYLLTKEMQLSIAMLSVAGALLTLKWLNKKYLKK